MQDWQSIPRTWFLKIKEFPTFKLSRTWPWMQSYHILSCITYWPLLTHQIPFELEEIFADKRWDIETGFNLKMGRKNISISQLLTVLMFIFTFSLLWVKWWWPLSTIHLETSWQMTNRKLAINLNDNAVTQWQGKTDHYQEEWTG